MALREEKAEGLLSQANICQLVRPDDLMVQEDLQERLEKLFSLHFSDSLDDIRLGIQGVAVPNSNYTYKKRKIFYMNQHVSTQEAGQPTIDYISCAAIIVPHKLDKVTVVWELVWFATHTECLSKGIGTNLFDTLCGYAKIIGVSALLVTSTNRALPWWLSRTAKGKKGYSLLTEVYRAPIRPNILSTNLSTDETENEKITATLKTVTENLGVKTVAYPTHALTEKLYVDKVERNRKGKLAKVQFFKGKPYRYDTEQSNHVWFLFANHLQSKLKMLGRK